jgi:hypothetical protein
MRSVEEWAADIFEVAVEHITLAPKYCGDGIDGACDAKDCAIVGAVKKLRAYAAEQVAALEARLRVETVPLPSEHYTDKILALEVEVERLKTYWGMLPPTKLADLTCSRHETWKMVWCNECIREEREARP